MAHGVTNLRSLTVGSLFTLKGFPREDQNREHLVVAASYDLTFDEYEALPGGEGAGYRCSFTTLSSQQQFRPKRATPKPFVQGPQTAVVVGPSGDEIYTDEYGRVKVQFHWDRRGEKNENSSCWIRVSHPWAGKSWGAVATPRIGQEVIVDFLEGDPDQPIITGRVYNAENQPPFGFPAGAVLSGVKSDTHKGNGFNEMSMDDTAGKERVFIHAQYNMDTVVEHDQTSTIHNNRTDRVDVDDSESVGNNQTWDVGANRDASIHANETLTVDANRTKSIGGNETITVTGNRDGTVNGSETLTVALQRTHSVGINETISVGAAQEITVGAMQAITVGANQTTNVGANIASSAGANSNHSAGSDMGLSAGAKWSASAGSDLSASAGGKMALTSSGDFSINGSAKGLIDLANELTIQCGGASIVLKSNGDIVIDGKNITITGSGKINATASSDINIKGSKIKEN
jgi:type VI secretion system secreted protein VgrG